MQIPYIKERDVIEKACVSGRCLLIKDIFARRVIMQEM